MVAEGEMVLESTMMAPSPVKAERRPGPKITRSTATVSATQHHTTSASLAASAGETAVRGALKVLPGGAIRH